MLQIKILIHVTGLLLLTAENRNGVDLTHVFMPKPYAFMPEHVAELGYREPDIRKCEAKHDWYDPDGKICYRDMSGFSMTIPHPLPNTGRSLPIPSGQWPGRLGSDIVDLSTVTHHYVRPSLFSDPPEGRLRSRITLSGARRLGSCALYTWMFDDASTEIANVVTWEIDYTAGDKVVLTRRRFGSQDEQPFVELPPDRGVVELFIRQVPPSERAQNYDSRLNLDARNALNAYKDKSRRATHFHAYYRLLHVPWLKHRPIPRQPTRTGILYCPWSTAADGRIAAIEPRGAGTAACMVAGGSTGP